MRALILAVVLAGFAGSAHANDVYLYDLLKNPTYLRAWRGLLNASGPVPAWVKDENRFVANPAKTVAINSESYSVSFIARQHATNEGQAVILFNGEGSKAWAEIQDEGRPKRYLGEPSGAQQEILDKTLAE